MSEKIFTCMQEVPNLHKNYSSGAIIWGSVNTIEEIILLLNNISMYNYTAKSAKKIFFFCAAILDHFQTKMFKC